jgi:outer membrane protein assembly factor BamB
MGTRVRRKAWFTGLLLASISLTGIVRGEDWPWFRGPSRQGISQEKDVPTQWTATSNIRWNTAIPGEGWSSPIVFGDRVFVTTALEGGSSLHMICLDRPSGKVVWDKEIARQKAGHKQQYNSYATPTPATDGTRIYVPACDGRILAVSMDGKVEWINSDFDYYYSEHGLAVSPVLYEDLVIVPFDWSSPPPDTKVGWQVPWDKAVILAVDKNTGKTRWKGSRGSSRIAHVTPQIAKVGGRDQLVSGAGNVIQGFDLQTGERLWTIDSPGEGVVPSVVIGEGLVFTASGFGESRVCAVRLGGRGNVTKTHTVWESRDDVPKMSSMLYVSPHLYLATETGVAKCFKAATGEVLWRERLGAKFSASPVWADGKIYFLAENGTMTVVEDGPQFKVVAQDELGEKCCASPAISQGNIFIRTEKALYCIGK